MANRLPIPKELESLIEKREPPKRRQATRRTDLQIATDAVKPAAEGSSAEAETGKTVSRRQRTDRRKTPRRKTD